MFNSFCYECSKYDFLVSLLFQNFLCLMYVKLSLICELNCSSQYDEIKQFRKNKLNDVLRIQFQLVNHCQFVQNSTAFWSKWSRALPWGAWQKIWHVRLSAFCIVTFCFSNHDLPVTVCNLPKSPVHYC